MQDSDKEKLRAFEKKMHDEGAAGFADGPRPWETWDESGAQAGKHVWEGKARRIYRNTSTPARRSLGERILSGLAMIALATMVVGIAGVYFTEEQPQTVAWTRIEPTPIPLPDKHETASLQRLPARAPRPAPVIAEIESLPPSAAGRPAGMAASAAVAAAETGTTTADTAQAGADAGMAIAADDTAAWPSDDGGADIEIVTAPTALLLRSTGDAYTDSSDSASGLEMDTALAMEIATAPAADSDIADTAAVASAAPAATITDNPWEMAAPATNLVNRDSVTIAPAAEDSTPAAAAIASSGEPPVEPGIVSPDDINPAATLDILPPTAAGAASNEDAPGAVLTDATAIPADSNATARDMPPIDAAESPLPAASETTVVALAEPEPSVAEPPPPAEAAAAPAGDWVVNLASYTYKSTAQRKLALFQSKGVTGEIERIVVNDKPLYRIRVTGFENSRAARASIPELQATLGLEGAWISKR